MDLTKKLREAESACLSAEAVLKTAKAQAEDQRKKLYTTEIELTTQKQFVMDLKAELKKAKDVAEKAIHAAKEATEAAERMFYERGVIDTKAQLAEEVAIVCRDYYTKSWGVAMNQAGVPIDSKLRRYENIIFLVDIQEIPSELPPRIALPLPPPEQPLVIQDFSLDAEVAIGAEKGEVQPPEQANQSEDQLMIKALISKAKDAEEADLQATSSKGDSKAQIYRTCLCFCCYYL